MTLCFCCSQRSKWWNLSFYVVSIKPPVTQQGFSPQTLCSGSQLCGRSNGLTQEVSGMAYFSLASQSLHKWLWAHFTEVVILLQLACMNITFPLEATDTELLLKSHHPTYSYKQNIWYKNYITGCKSGILDTLLKQWHSLISLLIL